MEYKDFIDVFFDNGKCPTRVLWYGFTDGGPFLQSVVRSSILRYPEQTSMRDLSSAVVGFEVQLL